MIKNTRCLIIIITTVFIFRNKDGTYILCNTCNIYEKTKLTYGKKYHSFYITDYYNNIIINIKNNENSILKYIERSNNINTMRKM